MSRGPVSSRYQWTVVGISSVAQLSNAMASLAIAPLATIFQPELGLTKAQVGFFSSAAFAGAWGVLLIAGSLTDRFGVRKMMAIGQLVTGFFILSIATAGSYVHALAVMLAAGLGRGITAPGVTKAVIDWFPPVGRSTAVAINQTAIPVAGILTASLLPTLALAIGWRGASATLGVVILAGALATAIFYRDRERPRTAGPAEGFRSSLGSALRNRRLWVVALVGPLYAGVQFCVTTYIALYYKEVILVPAIPDDRARIVAAGAYLAVAHAGSGTARMLWGLLGDRFFIGSRLTLLAAGGAVAAIGALMMSSLQPSANTTAPLLAAFLAGLLMMGTQGLYMLVSAETSGPECAGSGVGLCMSGTQIGFVAGPTVFGLILDVTSSYAVAWRSLAALAVIAAVVTALLARRVATTAPAGSAR